MSKTQDVIYGKQLRVLDYLVADADGNIYISGTKITATASQLNALVGEGLVDGGFTTAHKHTITEAESAPSNAVAASGTLTLTGASVDGETVTIGSDVYEFDEDGSVTSGNLTVDLSGGTKTQASGTLTFSGVTVDGELINIGDETYEIDTDGSVTSGNIQIDLSGSAIAATGTLTFTGVVSDGEVVVIGSDTYEFDTNGSITEGNTKVNVVGDQTAPHAITALVEAITLSTTESITAADGAGDTVVITASIPGTAANSIATTTDCSNASWGNANLTGGVDPPASNSVTAVVSAINTNTAMDITATDGTGDTVDIDADSGGALDGSAGNAIATTTDCSNGSWGSATLTGGSDATAAETVTALVSSITNNATEDVTAADGAGDTVTVTCGTAGTVGNSIATTETCTNASFGATSLEGGVDGTPGVKGECRFDSSSIYVCTDTNGTDGQNWTKASLSSY